MAFDPIPTAVIASWSEDGTTASFPIASVPELTAAEADAVTGDSRKIQYALIDTFYQWYIALAVADRPSKLSISRSTFDNNTTGDLQRNYTFSFQLTPTGIDVSSE